ncbi:MAG: phosphodiester glycosidase family protein [Phycisphaerales bacterium]|nr:MAG: phosphodiester glycosidase family protein [Phycisphaerales bacterium]
MRLVVLLLCAMPSRPAASWPRVEPGIEYLHERIGAAPWSIHVVKIERSRPHFQLVSALAQEHIYGLASVSEQVESVTGPARRPVAAINGDFFEIRPGPYQGDPRGVQIVNGELVSAPTGESFWVSPEGQPHMGEVQAAFRATGRNGLDLTFGLNEKCDPNAAILYTPAVGESTRTTAAVELVLEREGDGPWLPLRAGEHYQAKITAVRTEGNTALRPETMVLSLGPGLAAELPALTTGMTVSLNLETTPDLTGVTTALGAGLILVRGGQASNLKHYPHRHPRTALGWNARHLFLVVVDGRQEGLSKGMNYTELSALLLRLGCTEAINLDGGGSSTLWLSGQVMNSPSDGRQRRVANSLIVIATEPEEQP